MAAFLCRAGGSMLESTGSQGRGVGQRVPEMRRMVEFNCTLKTNNNAAHYGILLTATLPYIMSSQWHHWNKIHTSYSELNFLQNVYFGIFGFWKLTQRCRFVNFLWNDPRTFWRLTLIVDCSKASWTRSRMKQNATRHIKLTVRLWMHEEQCCIYLSTAVS